MPSDSERKVIPLMTCTNKACSCSGLDFRNVLPDCARCGACGMPLSVKNQSPPQLIEPCILAGSPEGGTVLDPFAGSGTTGQVAMQHCRHAVLIELNPAYVELIHQRIAS